MEKPVTANPVEAPVSAPRAKRADVPEWIKSYQAYNEGLRLKLAGEQPGQEWQPSARRAILHDVRAIAVTCASKAEILAAIDEMLDGKRITDSTEFKGGK